MAGGLMTPNSRVVEAETPRALAHPSSAADIDDGSWRRRKMVYEMGRGWSEMSLLGHAALVVLPKAGTQPWEIAREARGAVVLEKIRSWVDPWLCCLLRCRRARSPLFYRSHRRSNQDLVGVVCGDPHDLSDSHGCFALGCVAADDDEDRSAGAFPTREHTL